MRHIQKVKMANQKLTKRKDRETRGEILMRVALLAGIRFSIIPWLTLHYFFLKKTIWVVYALAYTFYYPIRSVKTRNLIHSWVLEPSSSLITRKVSINICSLLWLTVSFCLHLIDRLHNSATWSSQMFPTQIHPHCSPTQHWCLPI